MSACDNFWCDLKAEGGGLLSSPKCAVFTSF